MKPREVDWKTYYEKLWKPMPTMTPEPTESMSLAQFVAAREALRGALAKYEVVVPNCRSCTHFALGHCAKFDQDIPAEFQSQREECSEWAYDAIPF